MVRARNPEGFTTYIKHLCLKHVSEWVDLPVNSLKVVPLTGGCSNQLWKVTPQDSNQQVEAVVFRKYCPNDLVDRTQEAFVTSLLSDYDLTPRVFHDCEEYRIEDFIEGSHPETNAIWTDELVKVMALIHSIKPETLNSNTPVAFRRLQHFLDLGREVLDKDPTPQLDFFRDVSGMEREIDWLRDSCRRLSLEVGLCHNDLHALNILQTKCGDRYSKNTHDLMLIDFEFSDYNFIATEFANSFFEMHVNNAAEEWPHWSVNKALWPSQERQFQLVKDYLTHKNSTVPSKKQVQEFMSHIELGLLIQHLTWGIWSISAWATNTQSQSISWGYLEYGTYRLEEYYKCKSRFLEKRGLAASPVTA